MCEKSVGWKSASGWALPVPPPETKVESADAGEVVINDDNLKKEGKREGKKSG